MFRIIDKKLCSHLSNFRSIITAHFAARRELPSLKSPDSTPRTCKLRMQFANQKCHQFVEVSWCVKCCGKTREREKTSCDRLRKITSWKHCRWLWFFFCWWFVSQMRKGEDILTMSRLLLRNSSLLNQT